MPNYKKGEARRNAKLTEKKVMLLRALWSQRNYTLEELARMFGVGKHTVHCAITRKTWKHVK